MVATRDSCPAKYFKEEQKIKKGKCRKVFLIVCSRQSQRCWAESRGMLGHVSNNIEGSLLRPRHEASFSLA